MSQSRDRALLRIFPLPNVVLFPGVPLPLHVFEPRYRQLTEDALAGDRRMAIVTVRPERVAELAGDPPVFEVGCDGVIAREQRLPDGRYTFVLHGTRRFRILREPARPPERLYRVVEAEYLPDVLRPDEATQVAALRLQLLDLLRILVAAEQAQGQPGGLGGSLLGDADDATFVNAFCQYLGLPVGEKQKLLEAGGILPRMQLLVKLLQRRTAELAARRRSASETLH